MVTPANDNHWHRQFIQPWWTDEHRFLPYINEPFNDDQALAEWRALGYTQTRFTGDMYDMRNAEPQWITQFRHTFKWQNFGWSCYRMGPGTALPNHSDTYERFRTIHGIQDIETIYRAIVMLEDWQSGHYLEVAGTPVISWQQGDCVVWRGSTPHLAANTGKTDRYTLQITGIPHEDLFV